MIAAHEYVNAQRIRTLFRRDFDELTMRLVRAINFLGEPTLSMPCGKAGNGIPIGLQLVSAPFSDRRLLEIAGVIEAWLT